MRGEKGISIHRSSCIKLMDISTMRMPLSPFKEQFENNALMQEERGKGLNFHVTTGLPILIEQSKLRAVRKKNE